MRNTAAVFLAVLLLLVGIAVTSVARAAEDPNNGTWKLNLEKSKFNPGPALKSSTVTVKIENDTETYASDNVDASGNAIHGSFTAKLDGTDAPIAGLPYADTISIKRMSPKHLVATLKKGGTVMMTADVVLDADKMTRTVTYTGKNQDGKKVHDVLVYDMQM